MLAVWQPVQVDHKDAKGREDGSYSDMQKAEKMMAEAKGIRVLEFEFKEDEVNEMNTDGNFKQMDGSFKSAYDNDYNFVPAVMVRDETAFKQHLEVFLFDHRICGESHVSPATKDRVAAAELQLRKAQARCVRPAPSMPMPCQRPRTSYAR